MLKLSYGNSKIKKLADYLGHTKKQVASFDLPAGYTCRAAFLCQSFANRDTGKITDGKNMKFRCYAASSESAFPATRRLRWHNFDILKNMSFDAMVETIEASIPNEIKVLRIHSSGDYFTRDYFNAWLHVAKNNPNIMFFGYTKILEYAHYNMDNFKIVYSIGGKYDNNLTTESSIRVVETIEQGHAMGLPVACDNHPADDYDYIVNGQSFAIALHGTQPAGSPTNKKRNSYIRQSGVFISRLSYLGNACSQQVKST